MSIVRQTLHGVAWTAVARGVAQASSFVVITVLARLLEPADFGLIGMAAVVSGFLSLLGELGLGAALVQRRDLDERHRSSAFWLSLLSGAVLALLLVLAAPAIAHFYREPRLVLVIRVLALDFVIAPARSVQSALLSRAMAFRALATVEIIGIVSSSAVAISLALHGFGVWALVFRQLASSSIQTVALWTFSRWRPAFTADRSALKELWKFSSHLLGFAAINYWARKADDLLIGRFLGPGPLGLYTRAYGVMMLPLTEISGVLGKVMFPLLSRIQHDRERTKSIYLRSIAAISIVTFPLMLVLLVTAEPLVLALYGRKWLGMVPTLKIYCVVGAFQSIGTTVGWIYQSQGRTDWQLRYGVVASALVVAGFVAGVYIGTIDAVAVAYAFVSLVVMSYPLFAVPGRLIGMRVREVVKAVSGGALVAVAGAAVAAIVGWRLAPYVPAPFLLILQIVGGLGSSAAIVHQFRVGAYRDIRDLLARRGLEGADAQPPAGSSTPSAASSESMRAPTTSTE